MRTPFDLVDLDSMMPSQHQIQSSLVLPEALKCLDSSSYSTTVLVEGCNAKGSVVGDTPLVSPHLQGGAGCSVAALATMWGGLGSPRKGAALETANFGDQDQGSVYAENCITKMHKDWIKIWQGMKSG